MLHRLRHANKTKSFEFEGAVEADECYVGGLETNKQAKNLLRKNQLCLVWLIVKLSK